MGELPTITGPDVLYLFYADACSALASRLRPCVVKRYIKGRTCNLDDTRKTLGSCELDTTDRKACTVTGRSRLGIFVLDEAEVIGGIRDSSGFAGA